MRVSEVGEREVILRIRNKAGAGAPGVVVGIGDDCAVLTVSPGSRLLATTDLLLEGIHFRRSYARPEDIGWKAVAVNLSDIAAMGGEPRFALVALACPPETEVGEIDAFHEGVQGAAAPHGVVVVGGDTSSSPDGWIVNVTLLGEVAGAPRLRSGARPGDLIAVTGTLGEAAAGLLVLQPMGGDRAGIVDGVVSNRVRQVQLRPMARVAEGRWLGQRGEVRAMIDVSDGLATDLGHIARESGVGARVFVDRLPVSEAVKRVAEALGSDPVRLAVSGGEDYELLLTAEPQGMKDVAAGLHAATGTPLTVVGEIVDGPVGVAFVNARGEILSMEEGFEHFSGRRSG